MASNERNSEQNNLLPEIKKFIVLPEYIDEGKKNVVSIVWEVENAEYVRINDDPSNFPTIGSLVIEIEDERTFTLTAFNSYGIKNSSKQVKFKSRSKIPFPSGLKPSQTYKVPASIKYEVKKFGFDKSVAYTGDEVLFSWEVEPENDVYIEVFPKYGPQFPEFMSGKGELKIKFTTPGLIYDKSSPSQNYYYTFYLYPYSTYAYGIREKDPIAVAKIKVLPIFEKERDFLFPNTEIKTFKRFSEYDILRNRKIVKKENVFSHLNLRRLYVKNEIYYLERDRLSHINVYDKNPDIFPEARLQFSFAYAHKNGSGSATLDSRNLYAKAIYYQLTNYLLDSSQDFVFKDQMNSDSIFFISVARRNNSVKISPGLFSMSLGSGSGAITLVDDSSFPSEVKISTPFRVYNLVNSYYDAVRNSRFPATSSKGYGLIFPDVGMIVLNGDLICKEIPLFSGINSSSVPNLITNNNILLLDAFQTSFCANEVGFYAERILEIKCDHYFINLKNDEFNYTNNDTISVYIGDENKVIASDVMKQNPTTFFTTIGLYNDSYELLAVGKLNKPLKKDFYTEHTIILNLHK